MLLRQDLDELVTAKRQPAVSMYLPTHVAGREIRQDPIRLRNLIARADERLAKSWRTSEREALLAPARSLVEDEFFWRHQESGLAVFLAPDFGRIHKLPAPVPERVLVSDHFCVLPLIGMLDSGPYWLLTVTAARVRLYHGTRHSLAEVAGLELPQGVGEVRAETEYQQTHNASPVGRRGSLAKAQSFGSDPEDVRKTELIALLRRVAAAVEPLIRRQPAPLVLAAHPEIRGHFHEIARWDEIVPDGITENPDALPAGELHRRAFAAVEPIIAAARGAALDRLKGLLGTGRAATRPDDIITAAREGRVDTLFIADHAHIWGQADATGGPVEEEEDLIDQAGLEVLRHGGAIAPVAPAGLPGGTAAALLRY